MKRLIASALSLSFLAPAIVLAVDSKRAAYTGGTAMAFFGATGPIECDITTSGKKMMTLTATEQPFAGKTLAIPMTGSSTLSTGRKLADASAPQ